MNEMGRASAVAVAMMLVMLVFMVIYFRVLRARGEEPR
jgi:ABC-type sugar transport system permease subunit